MTPGNPVTIEGWGQGILGAIYYHNPGRKSTRNPARRARCELTINRYTGQVPLGDLHPELPPFAVRVGTHKFPERFRVRGWSPTVGDPLYILLEEV